MIASVFYQTCIQADMSQSILCVLDVKYHLAVAYLFLEGRGGCSNNEYQTLSFYFSFFFGGVLFGFGHLVNY